MKVLLFLLFLYGAFGLYLYLFQERIIFRSDLAAKDVVLPKGAKHLFFDGIEVGFLDRKSDTTLFYFGGNATNALEFLQLALDFHCNVVAWNYPGYGKSAGKPSQRAIFQAALKIFDHFRTERNILLGRSLGSGVAAFVASQRDVDKVILITPYHSIIHLAKLRYPIYPASLLVRHPFKTYAYIAKTSAPVYVILAQKDETTPHVTFEKLKPYLKNLQGVFVIEGSEHGNILQFEKTKEILKKIIEE